jgi:hypothetical protein
VSERATGLLESLAQPQHRHAGRQRGQLLAQTDHRRRHDNQASTREVQSLVASRGQRHAGRDVHLRQIALIACRLAHAAQLRGIARP